MGIVYPRGVEITSAPADITNAGPAPQSYPIRAARRPGTCRKLRARTLAAVARVYHLAPHRVGARWVALCPACGAQTLIICGTRGGTGVRWECPCGVAGNCPSELQRLAEGRPVTPAERLRSALAIVSDACDRHGPRARAELACLVAVLSCPAPEFSAAIDGVRP